LSLEAVQESVIEVWPTALVVSPVGVEGGVVSPGQAAVDALIDAFALWFPAASNASTAMVYAVPQLRLVAVALVPVVVATCAPFTYSV
jgi:hypothetical protein